MRLTEDDCFARCPEDIVEEKESWDGDIAKAKRMLRTSIRPWMRKPDNGSFNENQATGRVSVGRRISVLGASLSPSISSIPYLRSDHDPYSLSKLDRSHIRIMPSVSSTTLHLSSLNNLTLRAVNVIGPKRWEGRRVDVTRKWSRQGKYINVAQLWFIIFQNNRLKTDMCGKWRQICFIWQ